MKWWMLVWGIGLVVLLMACSRKEVPYQSLSVEEFEKLMMDPAVQRLDVRTVAEYSEGHITGSLNVNVLDEDSFLKIAQEVLHKEQPVAVYCRSGKRSKKAAEMLGKLGYKVFDLDKGFNSWKAAGKVIQK